MGEEGNPGIGSELNRRQMGLEDEMRCTVVRFRGIPSAPTLPLPLMTPVVLLLSRKAATVMVQTLPSGQLPSTGSPGGDLLPTEVAPHITPHPCVPVTSELSPCEPQPHSGMPSLLRESCTIPSSWASFPGSLETSSTTSTPWMRTLNSTLR